MGTRMAEIQPFIDAAKAQGWRVDLTPNSHLRFAPADPRKPVVFTGTSPSDVRSLRNLRSQLRRSGLKGI